MSTIPPCGRKLGRARHWAFLARLVPHLAEGLRKALLLGGSRATTLQPEGPGLVLLADDLSLVAITPAAEGWLAEVPESSWPSSLELSDAVYAVAPRLLTLERGGHTSPDLIPTADFSVVDP